MQYEGDEYPSTMKDILERGNTCLQNNRSKGIDIGCYDDDVDRLRYPLKLVSVSYTNLEFVDGDIYCDKMLQELMEQKGKK